MNKEQVFHIKNKEEMANLAQKLAKNSKKGDVFALSGTLGAGKSFFVREFIRSLSNQEIEVSSPTFNILNLYEIGDKNIYHFDFYRLDNVNELYNLGIEDAFINGISLIEWPKIAQDFLPNNCININIEIKAKEQRLVTLEISN